MALKCLCIPLLLLLISCRDGLSREAQAEMFQAASRAHPAGHVLYLEHCSSCHGLGARGGVGPRLTANGRVSDQGYVEGAIRRGQRGMPSFERALRDEDIAVLANFVVSLGDEGD